MGVVICLFGLGEDERSGVWRFEWEDLMFLFVKWGSAEGVEYWMSIFGFFWFYE